MSERGKFIVIYGANNLGKTVQANLLIDSLRNIDKNAHYLKYPIYDLEPTGPRINAALREGLNISDIELQKEFSQNRRDFEPTLSKWLEAGRWLVSEDYKGTGISWGVTHDIPLETMEAMNRGLLDEDLGVLLDGERFSSGIERNHRYESSSSWEKARQVHLELAKRYQWEVVNANRTREKVAEDIWKIVEFKLLNYTT